MLIEVKNPAVPLGSFREPHIAGYDRNVGIFTDSKMPVRLPPCSVAHCFVRRALSDGLAVWYHFA
jgi:hypothetical protein